MPDWLLGLRGGALIEWIFRQTMRRSAFDDEIIAIYRADACRPGALTAMLDWYRAAAPEIFATEEPAAPIETPTLMIWGERDVALDLCCLEGTERSREELAHRASAARHALDPGGRRERGQRAARRVALGGLANASLWARGSDARLGPRSFGLRFRIPSYASCLQVRVM